MYVLLYLKWYFCSLIVLMKLYAAYRMALMHKSPKPYKSRYTTAILSFLNRAHIRMRNVTIDTLVVLFVLRAVGKLAENVEVYFLCGKAVSMLL